MANAERQTSGIGPGSKDEPFVQMAVPTKPPFLPEEDIRMPFELDHAKTQIFDIFTKLIELRTEFMRAMDNPSVKKSQKIALKKSVTRLDKINEKLIQVPDFLRIFSVDKHK